MSFLSSYSNLTVANNLTTANLDAQRLVTNNASNIQFTQSDAGKVVAKGSFGNLTLADSPVVPANAFGANTQVLYNQGNTGNLTSSNTLTFNDSTNTMTATNFVTNANANVTYANLGDVANVRLTGGAANQVLVSDGLGNVRWTSTPSSSVDFLEYQVDTSITTWSFTYTPGISSIQLIAPNNKTQYLYVGALIAFTAPSASTVYYTITSSSSTPAPFPYTGSIVTITISPVLQSTVPLGQPCTLLKPVPVNTFTTNQSVTKVNVQDSVLTVSQNYNFTGNGQILLNNNNSDFAAASNVRYYETQQNNATANRQLVANGSITLSGAASTQNLVVTSHDSANATTPSISFAAAGTIAPSSNTQIAANNFTVTGTTYSKSFSSNRFKYARFEKTVQQAVPRSVYPTNWTDVTWDRTVLNTTGLTLVDNNKIYNNTGATRSLIISYSIQYSTGADDAGMAKGVGIAYNGDTEYGMLAFSCNHSSPNDNICYNASVTVDIANGDFFVLKASQNTDLSPQFIGAVVRNQIGGSLTIYVLN